MIRPRSTVISVRPGDEGSVYACMMCVGVRDERVRPGNGGIGACLGVRVCARMCEIGRRRTGVRRAEGREGRAGGTTGNEGDDRDGDGELLIWEECFQPVALFHKRLQRERGKEGGGQ